MSSLTLHQATRPSSVMEQIACCVEDLAHLAGRGCLVESADARLVAHHLLDPSPDAVTAVVASELSSLHRRLGDRRTTGLLPTGPVVEGKVGTSRIAYLTLRNQDRLLGGVWLFVGDGPLDFDLLREPVQRLVELLSCTTPDVPALAAILDGAPLPPELSSHEQLWVARVLADVPAELLQRSLSRTSGTVTLLPLRSGRQVYVVVAGPRRTTNARVLAAVQQLCDSAATRLVVPVTAGISCACESLPVARRQADLAASAAPSGSCSTLTSVRSALVARHLASSLTSLPDLGPDPLSLLLEYDRRRGAELVETLRAWLDECGDVARAIVVLGIHSNTLRYRIRRIEEITGVDLRQDAEARLELQLRLLALTS